LQGAFRKPEKTFLPFGRIIFSVKLLLLFPEVSLSNCPLHLHLRSNSATLWSIYFFLFRSGAIAQFVTPFGVFLFGGSPFLGPPESIARADTQ
jgi:hypothetical protein